MRYKSNKKKKGSQKKSPKKAHRSKSHHHPRPPRAGISGDKRSLIPIREIVLKISEDLSAGGHNPILIGRACAAIYTGNSIKTNTIEFAIKDYETAAVESIMKKNRFYRTGQHTYSNKRISFEIILTPMPVTVGDDVVNKFATIKTASGRVTALNPTDCVRHRLSSYYLFSEDEALADAVKIAKKKKIDMNVVARWSEWEWATDKFAEFIKALNSK